MQDTQERIITGGGYLGGIATDEPPHEKHIELDRAILHQGRVSEALSDLISRIAPAPTANTIPASDAKALRSTPTLGEILDHGPERIRKNTDDALDMIIRLESLLF